MIATNILARCFTVWPVAILASGVGEELLLTIMRNTRLNAKKLGVSGDCDPLHSSQNKDLLGNRLLQSIQNLPLFFHHFLLVAENITIQHIVWLYATNPTICLASDPILCNFAHQRGDVIFECRHRRCLTVGRTRHELGSVYSVWKVHGVFSRHNQILQIVPNPHP